MAWDLFPKKIHSSELYTEHAVEIIENHDRSVVCFCLIVCLFVLFCFVFSDSSGVVRTFLGGGHQTTKMR